MEILPQICSPIDDKQTSFYHLPLYMESQNRPKAEFPLIGFRISSHFNSGLLTSLDEIDMKGSDLVRVAFSNLKEIRVHWNEIKFKDGFYLQAEHACAAEKILDKTFINEAATLLKTNFLYLSIPARGVILAIGEKDYLNHPSDFEQKTWSYYSDVSKERVSDLIFKVEEGQIKNYSSLSKKVKSDNFANEDLPQKFYHQKATIKLINGDVYAKSLVGAPDIKILLEGCFQIILRVLNENESDNAFTGLIEFQTIPSRIIKTREHVLALNHFLNKLPQSELLSSWCNRTQKPIEISFIFGEDFKTGAMERKQAITLSVEK